MAKSLSLLGKANPMFSYLLSRTFMVVFSILLQTNQPNIDLDIKMSVVNVGRGLSYYIPFTMIDFPNSCSFVWSLLQYLP